MVYNFAAFFFFPRENKRYLFFTFVRICHWIEWELEMRDHEQILKKTLTIISYISCNPCFYKKGLQYCYNLYSTFIWNSKTLYKDYLNIEIKDLLRKI